MRLDGRDVVYAFIGQQEKALRFPVLAVTGLTTWICQHQTEEGNCHSGGFFDRTVISLLGNEER